MHASRRCRRFLRCRLRIIATALLAAVAPAAAGAEPATLRYGIVDAAGWRGGRAADIPSSVEETYSRDPAGDTVTVAVRFDRKGFAPLSPMLALAVQRGFPAVFDRELKTTDTVSPLGPLVGVEGADAYSYTVKGLGRYVLERPAPGAGKAPDALRQELDAQVGKLVAAGPLAPWLVLVNVPGSDAKGRGEVYWHRPSETLALLADAAPLLAEPMREKLLAYLRQERASRPPEDCRSVPFAAGARREACSPDPALLKVWEEAVLACETRGAPDIWSLYGLARYYESLGGTPDAGVMRKCNAIVERGLEDRDWATLYWTRGHTPAFNAVHGVNRLFAGFTGYVRLARMAGDAKAEALGWGMLARTAALRFAMGKYTQFLADSRQFNVDYVYVQQGEGRGAERQTHTIRVEGDARAYTLPGDPAWWVKRRHGNWSGDLVTWRWTRPLDNVRQVHRLDETGVDVWEWGGVDCRGTGQKRDAGGGKDFWYMRLAPYSIGLRDLTPELGRFLADRLRPEMEAYCARIAENQPHWNVAYAEAILSEENGFMTPCNAHDHFLARAWVLGESPAVLERLIDVPWLPAGDLFYIHKLAETVRAYRAADGGR